MSGEARPHRAHAGGLRPASAGKLSGRPAHMRSLPPASQDVNGDRSIRSKGACAALRGLRHRHDRWGVAFILILRRKYALRICIEAKIVPSRSSLNSVLDPLCRPSRTRSTSDCAVQCRRDGEHRGRWQPLQHTPASRRLDPRASPPQRRSFSHEQGGRLLAKAIARACRAGNEHLRREATVRSLSMGNRTASAPAAWSCIPT